MHLGNAVKYIARAGKKDPTKKIEDLEKAIWYIKRYIEVETCPLIPERPNNMKFKSTGKLVKDAKAVYDYVERHDYQISSIPVSAFRDLLYKFKAYFDDL